MARVGIRNTGENAVEPLYERVRLLGELRGGEMTGGRVRHYLQGVTNSRIRWARRKRWLRRKF